MHADELDLYEDLDAFQEDHEKKSKELSEWEEKYSESQKTIEAMKVENKVLNKKIKIMEMNFQSLLDTAKSEIKRKDTMISELRRDLDNIYFKRKIPAQQNNSRHEESRGMEILKGNQPSVGNPFKQHMEENINSKTIQGDEDSEKHNLERTHKSRKEEIHSRSHPIEYSRDYGYSRHRENKSTERRDDFHKNSYKEERRQDERRETYGEYRKRTENNNRERYRNKREISPGRYSKHDSKSSYANNCRKERSKSTSASINDNHHHDHEQKRGAYNNEGKKPLTDDWDKNKVAKNDKNDKEKLTSIVSDKYENKDKDKPEKCLREIVKSVNDTENKKKESKAKPKEMETAKRMNLMENKDKLSKSKETPEKKYLNERPFKDVGKSITTEHFIGQQINENVLSRIVDSTPQTTSSDIQMTNDKNIVTNNDTNNSEEQNETEVIGPCSVNIEKPPVHRINIYEYRKMRQLSNNKPKPAPTLKSSVEINETTNNKISNVNFNVLVPQNALTTPKKVQLFNDLFGESSNESKGGLLTNIMSLLGKSNISDVKKNINNDESLLMVKESLLNCTKKEVEKEKEHMEEEQATMIGVDASKVDNHKQEKCSQDVIKKLCPIKKYKSHEVSNVLDDLDILDDSDVDYTDDDRNKLNLSDNSNDCNDEKTDILKNLYSDVDMDVDIELMNHFSNSQSISDSKVATNTDKITKFSEKTDETQTQNEMPQHIDDFNEITVDRNVDCNSDKIESVERKNADSMANRIEHPPRQAAKEKKTESIFIEQDSQIENKIKVASNNVEQEKPTKVLKVENETIAVDGNGNSDRSEEQVIEPTDICSTDQTKNEAKVIENEKINRDDIERNEIAEMDHTSKLKEKTNNETVENAPCMTIQPDSKQLEINVNNEINENVFTTVSRVHDEIVKCQQDINVSEKLTTIRKVKKPTIQNEDSGSSDLSKITDISIPNKTKRRARTIKIINCQSGKSNMDPQNDENNLRNRNKGTIKAKKDSLNIVEYSTLKAKIHKTETNESSNRAMEIANKNEHKANSIVEVCEVETNSTVTEQPNANRENDKIHCSESDSNVLVNPNKQVIKECNSKLIEKETQKPAARGGKRPLNIHDPIGNRTENNEEQKAKKARVSPHYNDQQKLIHSESINTTKNENVVLLPTSPATINRLNGSDNIFDISYSEIDKRLENMFQSPPPKISSCQVANFEITAPINTFSDETTENKFCDGFNASSASIVLPADVADITHTNETIDETIHDTMSSLNSTHNISAEIKQFSLGSSDYRFEKVDENVVSLVITRKRGKKRKAVTITTTPSTSPSRSSVQSVSTT